MTKTSVVFHGSFGFVALVDSQTHRTGRLLYKSPAQPGDLLLIFSGRNSDLRHFPLIEGVVVEDSSIPFAGKCRKLIV